MQIDKDSVLAAIQSAVDAINALPDLSAPPSDSDLQKQLDDANASIADLQKKNSDAADALSAEVAKEADDSAQLAAAQAKIDAAKAALA